MKIMFKNLLYVTCLTLVFQGCSDDDSTSTTGSSTPSYTAPATYVFESQFDTESSVSFSGQTARNMLIAGIKSTIAGTGSGTSTTASNLLSLYNNDDATALYTDGTTTYHSISTSANLNEKISPATTVEGYTLGPDALIKSWFDTVVAGDYDITSDGVHLDQMVGKALLGMVAYYQGTSVYLPRIDEMDGSAYAYDNTVAVSGKNYTKVEHYWDESFGYFGAARNYSTQTTDERKDGGSGDYGTAVNFDWAKYAAKRSDCANCTTGDFDDNIINAYIEGRAMITAGEPRTEIVKQRTIIVENWEKVVAANVIHYANDVAELITAGGETFDCSQDASCSKYWSEMRAFGLCLQFNTYSDFATTSAFGTMISAMGNAPPTASNSSTFVTGVATTNAALKSAFGFSDADISNF